MWGVPKWASDLYEKGAETVALLKSAEKELDRLRVRCDQQHDDITKLQADISNLEHELRRVEERARSEGRDAAQTAILNTYGDTIKGFFEMKSLLENSNHDVTGPNSGNGKRPPKIIESIGEDEE